jgi:hypothetical protein
MREKYFGMGCGFVAAIAGLLLFSTDAYAGAVNWTSDGGDNAFGNRRNWDPSALPGSGDTVFINLAGNKKAVVSRGDTLMFDRLYVGSIKGREGELEITGGKLTANLSQSTARCRIGAGGGVGTVSQSGGAVEIGHLIQIGLSVGSAGTYNLSGGSLTVYRGSPYSFELGHLGTGTMNISGGTFITRSGVNLQPGGTFVVTGSGSTGIRIGSNGSSDGCWNQTEGAVLKVLVDEGGVSRIFIDYVDGTGDQGNVVFENGALLDVSFLGSAKPGSWDVMHWEGALTDNGLAFAAGVDKSAWSFDFVDTNGSGQPDTLRITYRM